MLLHGLWLMLRHPGALLWTYFLNLGIALVFSVGLHAELGNVLDHSLAAERLNSAFDLGTLGAVIARLNHGVPSRGSGNYMGLPLYWLFYFVLVPGALFCYRQQVPAQLGILLSGGFRFFWRFVRITLLTLVISAVLLVPLAMLNGVCSEYVEGHPLLPHPLLLRVVGMAPLLLVAALLRLYFDLVEVYTVQLADEFRPSGKPDRRMRRTLLPALRTLRANFARAYVSFVTLALCGFAAFAFCGLLAAHRLAQPRAWPVFLLTQLGLLLMLATRFWQRAAETVLACDNPMTTPSVLLDMSDEPNEPVSVPMQLKDAHVADAHVEDAQPDPEPASPSLDQPDPGVFHHEPGEPPTGA